MISKIEAIKTIFLAITFCLFISSLYEVYSYSQEEKLETKKIIISFIAAIISTTLLPIIPFFLNLALKKINDSDFERILSTRFKLQKEEVKETISLLKSFSFSLYLTYILFENMGEMIVKYHIKKQPKKTKKRMFVRDVSEVYYKYRGLALEV